MNKSTLSKLEYTRQWCGTCARCNRKTTINDAVCPLCNHRGTLNYFKAIHESDTRRWLEVGWQCSNDAAEFDALPCPCQQSIIPVYRTSALLRSSGRAFLAHL